MLGVILVSVGRKVGAIARLATPGMQRDHASNQDSTNRPSVSAETVLGP